MIQHHCGGKQQGGWVCNTFAGNIRCSTVHGLKDSRIFTNITARCQTKTTDESGNLYIVSIGGDVFRLEAGN